MDLIIALDCGIKAWTEVHIERKRIDFIICVSSSSGNVLPEAVAVWTLKKDCSYPYDENSVAVGHWFQLIQALDKSMAKISMTFSYPDLVITAIAAEICSIDR